MQAYIYVRTMAADAVLGSRWTTYSDSVETINNILTKTRRAFIVVYDTVEAKQVAIDILVIAANTINLDNSVVNFLIENNDRTLDHFDVPEINPKLVKYSNAFRIGFQANTVKPGFADDALLLPEEKPDLKLTRLGMSYSEFERYCLLSVNGYFHEFTTNSSGIYVTDAMKSVNQCGFNQVGVYNFKDVGSIQKIDLSNLSVFQTSQSVPLNEQLAIDIGVDASNKYAIFFIAGYMIPAVGNIIRQSNSSIFTMAFNRFDWLNKFYEASRFLDLTALDLLASPTDEYAFYREEIISDRAIKNIFNLPQTFCALVDSPDFFIEKAMLPITRLPGMYRSYGKVNNLPLQLGHGRMAEYWLQSSNGMNGSDGIFVADGYKYQRNYNTTDPSVPAVINASSPALNRVGFSDAWFLQMGRDF